MCYKQKCNVVSLNLAHPVHSALYAIVRQSVRHTGGLVKNG